MNPMISFFEKIFSAITTAVVSVIVSLGLMSAPAAPQTPAALEPAPIVQEQIVTDQKNPLTEAEIKKKSVSQKSTPAIQATPPQPTKPPSAPIVAETSNLTSPEPVAPTPSIQTIAPPSPTPVYVPPVQTPPPSPTPVPTAQPAPELAPAPSGPIASSISVQNQVCNLSLSNLKTEYFLHELLQGGNIDGRIFMNAYVLSQDGQNFYGSNPSAAMTITTSNHSNDKTLNGSGNTGPCGYYYPYEFYATQAGTYTITYSIPSLNLSKTMTIIIKLPEKPIIGSSGITISTPQAETDYPLSELNNLSDTSNVKYWFQSSKPDNKYLALSAWCSDVDTPFTKVEMVGSFNSADGLYYYRGRFSGGSQFSGTVTCKLINSADSSMTMFSESDPVSINVK